MDDFQSLFEIYKARFGQTFSYYDTANDERKMKKAIALMQQAIDGKRGAISNKELGIVIPKDAVS